MEESFCITVGQSTMKERVMEAAREGDIEALYGLIREKADVLREIDQMEFVDTPLHIAAGAGRIEFAMELMYLKPSFATKLNQDGLSPIHLALQNGKSDTVFSLLKFDKNLVRVQGKNGYTPLHYVVRKGDPRDLPVLAKFLEECPNCIHDVTNRDESALHLAAKNNNLKAFKVLLQWLWSSYNMSRVKRILNLKNRDGDNVLHIAASKNQPKIVRLLTEYKFDLKATNSEKLTALGILHRNLEADKECVNILRRAQNLSAFNSILLHLLEPISPFADEIRNMSCDRCNALLVVTVLILTATYQAILSPSGGVFQADSHPKDTSSLQIHSGSHNTSIPRWDQLLKRSPSTAGSSVLDTAPFLWFFIPNIVAFYISFIVTCFILANLVSGFLSFALIISLCMLLLCLLVSAVMIISPNSVSLRIMQSCGFIPAYFLAMVMFLIILQVLYGSLRRRHYKRRYKKYRQTMTGENK